MGNTVIFFMSQFASKVLSFLMLPLYTAYMSPEGYGTADMVLTTVNLLLPILGLSLSAAASRFVLEKAENTYTAFWHTVKVLAIGTVLLVLGYPIFKMTALFPGVEWMFYLYFFLMGTDTLLTGVARGLGFIKTVGITGVVKTAVIVSLNVLFLTGLRWDVQGYLLAYILAFGVASVILLLRMRRQIKKTLTPEAEKLLRRDMIRYSTPLIPNSVSWWLISSFNKYVIRGVCGSAMLGLYSAASKLPSMLVIVQNILSEAFTLSVVEEYDKKGDKTFFTVLYNQYNCAMVLACSALLLGLKLVSRILLSEEYFAAWQYVPFLLIAAVFGATSGYLGTFYSASKKNTGMLVSTLLGGGISVVLNLFMVREFGILASTITNLLAYVVIWLYRLLDTRRFIKLKLNLMRDVASYLILVAQALMMIFCQKRYIVYPLQAILLGVNLILYRKDLTLLVQKLWAMLPKKKTL